jgi:hypothetical protein
MPRAFSESALTPVFELNGFFLELLTAFPSHPSHLGCAWSAALRPELHELTGAARVRIARSPVCLVDAGFQDEACWDVMSSPAQRPVAEGEGCLPAERAIELTQMTVTLAWTVARTSLEGACIIFGMTSRCARIVSGLSVHRIPALAERNAHTIRPAWMNHPEIWPHLLSLADPAPASRLPPVHVRAMQRQLADFVLATSASQPIRQPHR